MPNEFQFEVAFDANWVRECLKEEAEKIIVSGVISCNGDTTNIELKGMKADETYLQYAVKGCPMPCPPPRQSTTTPTTN